MIMLFIIQISNITISASLNDLSRNREEIEARLALALRITILDEGLCLV
jgi:hypothetical protein